MFSNRKILADFLCLAIEIFLHWLLVFYLSLWAFFVVVVIFVVIFVVVVVVVTMLCHLIVGTL